MSRRRFSRTAAGSSPVVDPRLRPAQSPVLTPPALVVKRATIRRPASTVSRSRLTSAPRPAGRGRVGRRGPARRGRRGGPLARAASARPIAGPGRMPAATRSSPEIAKAHASDRGPPVGDAPLAERVRGDHARRLRAVQHLVEARGGGDRAEPAPELASLRRSSGDAARPAVDRDVGKVLRGDRQAHADRPGLQRRSAGERERGVDGGELLLAIARIPGDPGHADLGRQCDRRTARPSLSSRRNSSPTAPSGDRRPVTPPRRRRTSPGRA